MMDSGRLIRWLLWIALIVLFVQMVGRIARFESSRPTTRPAIPEEHRLFHYWWVERGGGWIRDIPVYDGYGSYFYKDLRVNVAALAILRTKGILPHTDGGGIADAAEDHARLFPGTRFAVTVRAKKDTFVVIQPDLSMVSFGIQADDVSDMRARLHDVMQEPAGSFSLVAEIQRWSAEHGRTELMRFLDQYRSEHEAEQYVPGPKEDASERGRPKG